MPGAAESDDGARAVTTIVVVTGERYEVEGLPSDVEATIVAASRGSIMQLAWVTEAGSGRSIAVNPLHVVAIELA
ncbi:MAG TPA: hypothetical protein VF257_03100 [Solirubrobacteraceae bacterium]